jgi:putative transposase
MPDILPLLLCLHTVLPKTTGRQLARIVLAMLVMPGPITQRSIARWADKGGSERTIHRFFHSEINRLEVKWLFFWLFVYAAEDTYLLVGDETVLKKAGKHTFGLDRFFSSLAAKPVPGVAFFALALVSVKKRQAYTLCAEQVVRSEEEKAAVQQRRVQKQKPGPRSAKKKKPRGRPQGSKNKNKATVVLSAELTRILGWTKKVLDRVEKKVSVGYFVLDGHFGNHPTYQMTRQLGLHLISKLRHNAALYLLPSAQDKQAHPRLKYGTRLDYGALPLCWRVACEQKGSYREEVYQMPCRHKDFADVLNIVILVKTELDTNRRGHVVLFSSDLNLEALTLIDDYTLRFQIEFEFRDAKQHFGLSDFRCVSQTGVNNAVGVAFFVGNLSAYLLAVFREACPEAGIADLKSYYRGRRYVAETLKYLPDLADDIVWERVMEQVCRLGWIHPGSNPGERGLSGHKRGASAADRVLDVAA